jgi:hypothetical protein
MRSRAARLLSAFLFVLLLASSSFAATENRSESGEWLSRQVNRVVQQLKKIFAPLPLDEIQPVPPKP